ncbi:MAG TPA: hypothetical protein VFR97_06110 [Capillimicrobium sp.]|nr:hypothetical protein [Capillimicrobium sp.]
MSRAAVGDADAPDAWRTDAVRLAAVISGGAGVVHLVAAREHFGDETVYGALFVLAGVLQLAWAALAWRRADRRVLVAGIALQLGIALAWALSRTVGLPSGETPWRPEAIGPLDAQATADELLAAALAGLALRRDRGHPRLADVLEALGLLAVAGTWLMLAVGAEHGH